MVLARKFNPRPPALLYTGPGGVQVTIISYNVYQTLKLLVTSVVLTLASLDQMVYNST